MEIPIAISVGCSSVFVMMIGVYKLTPKK